jgi:hypothetical protein
VSVKRGEPHVGCHGDGADFGVVLDGEFAGTAVGGGGGPELAGGLIVGAVAAVLVVPGLVAVTVGLEFGQGGRG